VPALVRAELGNLAGLVGAAVLARERFAGLDQLDQRWLSDYER